MSVEKTVLITGSNGFVGRNLQVALSRLADVRVLCFDQDNNQHQLAEYLQEADLVFHLAGVNRPKDPEEFTIGNKELTENIVSLLEQQGRTPVVVMSSSTQAALDNPYGQSKKAAEECLLAYGARTGAPVFVYRLTNIFGKWSRPNYNSVVSTFCYNISHGSDITMSSPDNVVELIYIDDVVAEFLAVLQGERTASSETLTAGPTYRITLADLADSVSQFRSFRTTLKLPDMSDDLTRKLYATYLSYLEPDDFAYELDIKRDHRGELAELIKSESFGQIFVSRTCGKIIRGNHYHDTKIEKFCVLQGEAAIRFRHLFSDETIDYRVSGAKWEVVDIPPGYTHHIENLSDQDMIVLFWANCIFDPQQPDTVYCEVQRG